MKQISSSVAEFAGKKRQTRRERFLANMEEKVVPWTAVLKIIEPYHLKGQRGRPPIGLD